MPITPETKNWTWVLERRCPACGFDAPAVDRQTVGRLTRDNAALWPEILKSPYAAIRPTDERWSGLEYACHTIDTFARYFLHDPVHHVDDVRKGFAQLGA